MCDKKSPTEEVNQETAQGIKSTYVYDTRQDLEQIIQAYRDRANALQALLDSIPKSITPEAHHGLSFMVTKLWQAL